MKDKEINFEEIEASHALGGAGEVTRGGGAEREGVDDTRCHTHFDISMNFVIICE